MLSDVRQKPILYVESLVQDIDSFQRLARRDKILSGVLSDKVLDVWDRVETYTIGTNPCA